jgi:hypothetical protein
MIEVSPRQPEQQKQEARRQNHSTSMAAVGMADGSPTETP